ncbi:4'-phosphopantetheinyl transferase superfamily protein [Kitasatospora sp. NPDC098652]|uniref:4'-phosphopantetheinyl transferase superfamily protein n=1 Tax=Kitasatospora sp. NPDC098652 TaxID=3364095 RepID=UPI003827B098
MSRAVRVEVWFVDLDAFGARSGLAELLDGPETERLGRFGDPRAARRFTAAHAALRLITAAHCGVSADSVRWAITEHGKPVLDLAGPGPQVSLSHSDGRAAIALVPGRRPIGVDLELVRPEPPRLPARAPDRLRQWSASGRPYDFYRAWTRMEACVKAAGARLTDGLDLPVSESGPEGPVRAEGGTLAGTCWYVRDLAGPTGYAAAVALAGRDRFAVRTRRWDARRTPALP